MEADYILNEQTIFQYNGESLKTNCAQFSDVISLDSTKKISCILVDECQFLNVAVIDQLHFVDYYC